MRRISVTTILHWTLLLLATVTSLLSLKVIMQNTDYSYFSDVHEEKIPTNEELSGKSIIYMATGFFGGPVTNDILEKCPDHIKKTCYVTNSVPLYANAGAVVFHSRDFDQKTLTKFQSLFYRYLQTPYVMIAMENPYYAKLHEYSNFFNWTMTYRTDSDVYYPYGGLVENKEPVSVNYTELYDSKPKNALWLVSNNYLTNNNRKALVELMVDKGLDVDLFGKLYKEPPGCSRFGGTFDCDVRLHSPYKFTIAFENNNCIDYVSEKFWRKALRYRMIPIVMTRKIYRNLKIPDEMYIAVDDFPKLEDFINHVKKVAGSREEFEKYHKWRENFRIVDTNEEHFGFCDLCQKVKEYEENQKKTLKSYPNLVEWHNEHNQCDNSFADRYL